ncbi:MAG: sensor histidine kinase [Sphingobacteriaceae bacterium]
MKKKLTAIFAIIVFCLLGIIYLQADWLYKTYEIQLKELGDDANYAFAVAIQTNEKENQEFIRNLISTKLNYSGQYSIIYSDNEPDSLKISLGSEPVATTNTGVVNQGSKKQTDSLTTNKPTMAFGFSVGRIDITLPTRTGNKFTYHPDDVRLEKDIRKLISDHTGLPCNGNNLFIEKDNDRILKLFLNELAKKNIHPKPSLVQLLFACSERKPYPQYSPYKSILAKNGGTGRYAYASPGFERYASDGKRWVGAYFHAPWLIILPGMIWPLVLSLVLILVTIFSFVMLFKIILRQKKLSKMKDDFTNNMTHEFKTPIATISAAIEGMQNFNALQDKEKTSRYLETSRKELRRLDALVTKVLNIAAYESGELKLHISKVNIAALISDIQHNENLKATKKINFDLHMADDLQEIEVDPVHFRNSLSNVIDNAIKYSGNEVNIEIHCYQDNQFTSFCIKDDGIGIPASEQERIFDKFHRVPTGNVHLIKGSGLGLNYTKHIIEQHQGSISVKSEPGKGSDFLIRIPTHLPKHQ